MSGKRMQPPADLPFDGKRMVHAGFDGMVDDGHLSRVTYLDGFVTPVAAGARDRYLAFTEATWPVVQEFGAIYSLEAWGGDVPKGAHTDFRRAVAATDGEAIVFSAIGWPDRATRDAGMAKMMTDERMRHELAPFDMARMIYGGFAVLFDSAQH